MKKVLLSLFMAIICLPMAFGQTKGDRVFLTQNETGCGSFTWTINNVTYTEDTTVMYVVGDTVYVLNLTVNPAIYDTAEVVEATGTCFYIAGNDTLVSSGIHYATFKSASNCDSIVKINLTLTNEGLVIDDTLVSSSCDKYVASWGDTLTASGTYTHSEANGACTNNHMLVLTINASLTDTSAVVIDEVEAGCSYVWNGTTYTDTAIHYVKLRSVAGCDSLAAVHVLSYSNHNYDTANVVACGNQYTWYGRRFTSAAQADTTIVAGECTTDYHLNLTFGDAYDTIVKSGCAQYVYTFPARSGIAGRDTSETFTTSGLHTTDNNGVELYSKHWSTGCITHHALQLTIVEPQQRERDTVTVVSACDKYVFTVGRTSSDTLRNDTTFTLIHYAHGSNGSSSICYDSIGTIDLTIRHSTVNDTVVSACDTFYWDFNDTYYTFSTVEEVKDTILNEEGCSVMGKLRLTINRTPTVTIEGKTVLTPDETSTTLTAISDDSHVTYKWYKGTATTPASTTNKLELTGINSNIDVHLVTTSNKNCVANNWVTITSNVGIDEVENLKANIYPNPTARILNIESAEAIREAAIYNMIGQQVLLTNGNSNEMHLDLGNLANGQYTLRITSVNGDQITRKISVSK